jgi:hypothetical protein
MIALISLALNLLAAFFKSKSRLEAENAALRQQLIVLQRKVRGRVLFDNGDRLLFVQLYRWFPSILEAMRIIRPQTLVRWHRHRQPRFIVAKRRADTEMMLAAVTANAAALLLSAQPRRLVRHFNRRSRKS